MSGLSSAHLLRVYAALEREAATPERRAAAAMRAAMLRRQLAKEAKR